MLKCKICGRKVKKLTQRGLCDDCSKDRISARILQMKVKEGPIYDRWKKGMRKYYEENLKEGSKA